MLNLILSFCASLILSLFLTPLMIMIAKKLKIMDQPSDRKEHKQPMPLLGGIGILCASLFSFVFFTSPGAASVVLMLIISTIGVSVMGLVDDIVSLSAKRRLVMLFVIALAVLFGCIQWYSDAQHLISRNLLSIIGFSVFIIFWIVGVTNAINFSDGLDGLASYLSSISAISFAIIFAYQGRDMLALPITLALLGAIAGFIPYNRNPALIFMGDSGSMFIGFILSLLAISSIRNENTLFAMIIPVYFLFVPILDMGMSILRRLVSGKSIMAPDKMHFHHQLNKRLSNHLLVVIILSLVQILFSAIGILLFITKAFIVGWFIIGGAILAASVFTIISTLRSRKEA